MKLLKNVVDAVLFYINLLNHNSYNSQMRLFNMFFQDDQNRLIQYFIYLFIFLQVIDMNIEPPRHHMVLNVRRKLSLFSSAKQDFTSLYGLYSGKEKKNT